MKLLKLAALLSALTIFLVGCGTQQSSKGEKIKDVQKTAATETTKKQVTPTDPVLYQNKELGLTLYQTDQWKKTADKSNAKDTNVAFEDGKVRVIVSIVSSKNSITSIKKDILKSVTSPKTLSESNTLLDFESGTKEKMRITTTFKTKGSHVYIFSFVTPSAQYQAEKSAEQSFMDKVSIN